MGALHKFLIIIKGNFYPGMFNSRVKASKLNTVLHQRRISGLQL
jgi:hypothetical protein